MKRLLWLALIASIVATLLPFHNHAQATKYLRFVGARPTPSATPTPPAGIVGAYDYVGSIDSGPGCPTSLPTNAIGCAFIVKWAQIEPQSGQFDWSTIKSVLDHGYPVQIGIQTGMYGTPDSQPVCDSLTHSTTPTCQPWLSGISGVSTTNTKSTNNVPCSASLKIPNPGDSAYAAAYRGMLSAFDAKYGGNPQISYVSIAPISYLGNDI